MSVSSAVGPQHLDWLAAAGLRGPVFDTLLDLHTELWANSFDPRLMELMRIRTAQLLGVTAEIERRTPRALSAGLDEETIAELPQWPRSPRFDARDRAALGWAEQWIIDVRGITDEDAAHLQSQFTARELSGLTMAISVFEMLIRARAALDPGS